MVGAEEKTHSVHNSAVVFPLRLLSSCCPELVLAERSYSLKTRKSNLCYMHTDCVGTANHDVSGPAREITWG